MKWIIIPEQFLPLIEGFGEHDDEFKDYLRRIRAMAVDMETATIFSVGFVNSIPRGALLLVSD